MKTICIAGGTGLIGDRMVQLWKDKYQIHILTRKKQANKDNVKYFEWDIYKNKIDIEALKCDYLINLNGAGIADARWTASRKKLLVESRVKSNETLVIGLNQLKQKPESIVCASAIGFYGDRANEILDESSKMGEGFMVECCSQWEESARLLKSQTPSFHIGRIGVVMSLDGGALPKMLMTKPFKFLTYFGNGKMYYSWIHIDDVVNAFEATFLGKIKDEIINIVSPTPNTNFEMMKQMAKAYNCLPILFPAPAFILRLIMGEMANVVLNSNRVVPKVLENSGFEWKYPTITKW